MKRLGSLVSKAGDAVQQANQEYQRLRQEAKQQYQQQQQDVQMFQAQQAQQYAQAAQQQPQQQQSYYPGQPPQQVQQQTQQYQYPNAYQPTPAPSSTPWSAPVPTVDPASNTQTGRIPRKEVPGTPAQYQTGYGTPGQPAATPAPTNVPQYGDANQQMLAIQNQIQQAQQQAQKKAQQHLSQHQALLQNAEVEAAKVRANYELQLQQAEQQLGNMHLQQEQAIQQATTQLQQEQQALQHQISQSISHATASQPQSSFPGPSPTPAQPGPTSAPPPDPYGSNAQASYADSFEPPPGPPPGPPPSMNPIAPSGPPPQSPVIAQQPTYGVHMGAAPTPFPQVQGYPPPLLPSDGTPAQPSPAHPAYATPSQTPAPQNYGQPPISGPNVIPGHPQGYPSYGGAPVGNTYQSAQQPIAEPPHPVELPTASRMEQEGPFQLDAPLGDFQPQSDKDRSQADASLNANGAPRSRKPPIRRSGTPEPATMHASGVTPLWECSSDPVTYEMDWLYNSAAPTFLMCGRCYVDHVYDTQFKDSFTKISFTDKKPRKCLFGTDRVKEGLWPDALSSNSLESLTAYMIRRVGILECSEETIKEGESWYTIEQIPGMTVCKACYEDNIGGTSFAPYFKLELKPGQCFCDFTVWYFRRLLETYIKTENWATVIEKMNVRENLPLCPRQTIVKANDRTWYTSTRGPQNLTLCVACYYDYFHDTGDERDFQQVPSSDTNVRCIMAYMNLLIPTRQALVKKDREVFWKALQAVDEQPFCNPEGTTDAVWYTLIDEPQEFAICGGCYGGIVCSSGGRRFFKQHRTLTKQDSWICCMSLNHIRGTSYLVKYSECLAKGTARPLAEFVGTYGDVPLCSGKNLTADQKFYGWEDLAICQECYLTCARGTVLERHFTLKGETGSKQRVCGLYSARMRRIYSEACDKNDLQGLLAVGRHRHEVWARTVPICSQILAQHKMAAERAMTLAMAGTMFHAAGALVDVSQGHTHTLGNSYVGYGYANSMEMEGAVLSKQSGEIAAGVNNPLQFARVGLLEKEWGEVE